jgi:hypothetical protein
VGERCVDLRKFLQGSDTGLEDEREWRQRDAPLLRRPFQLLAPGLEIGDIGKIVLRDMGQVDPAGLQPRAGDLLDARQRLQFDFAEFLEIDFRRLRQARACRCRGLAREDGFDEGLTSS